MYGKKIKEETLATLDLLSAKSSFLPKNMNGIYINDFSIIFYYDFSKRKLNPMGVYKSDINKIYDWSRDGKKFLYGKGIGDYRLGLFSLVEPRRYREILPGGDYRIFDAKFIPNSRNIVIQKMVVESVDDWYGNINMINLDTGRATELTRDYGLLTGWCYDLVDSYYIFAQMDISPDGKYLAYIANYVKTLTVEEEYKLIIYAYLLNLERPEEKPRKIVDGVSGTSQVSWSPNGKYIVIDNYLL